MPDDTFEIGFETTGDAKAVRAFEALKIEQRELQTQSKALSARLRELEAAGETNSTEFKELSRAYVQAREASSQLGRQASGVSRSMRGQARAAQASTAALGNTRKASQNAGRNMGMLVNSVAELGYSFGTAIPGMQTYGTQLAMMGGNAVTFGAAMGPVGVAIGVVSGLLPAAIGLFNDFSGTTRQTSRDMHTLATETKSATEELESLVSALERQQQLAALESRVELGMGSEEEQQAFVQQAEQGLAIAEARLEAEQDRQRLVRAQQAGVTTTQAEEFENRLVELRRERLAAEEELERRSHIEIMASVGRAEETRRQLAEDAAEDAENARTSAARRGIAERERLAAEARQRELEATRAWLERIEGEGQTYLDALAAQEEAARQKTLQDDIRFAQRREEEQVASARRTAREQLRIWSENLDARQARNRQAHEEEQQHLKEVGQITEGMWSSIGGSVMDIAGQTTKFLIKGAEGGGDAFLAMLDSFLEATAIEYTIKALGEAANAVAAAARGDGAGAAQHAIAAGLAAGVAAATGLASAAIQTPSAATAGGGGSSAQPQAQPQGQGGGTTNVTVQLYAPNAVMTDAERGLFVQQSLRAARREYGPAGER